MHQCLFDNKIKHSDKGLSLFDYIIEKCPRGVRINTAYMI
jgi:hypothetical protein